VPRLVSVFFLALLLGSCATPCTPSYRAFYAHLHEPLPPIQKNCDSDYFLIIYVDARHLDYTDNASFFRTVAKHPSDLSKNRDVGHAWIYLQGILDGESVYIEGGHSGERGLCQAKYFDGIMNYIDFGYANPTRQQMECPRYEPNPAKYFWDVQYDGHFEWGPGKHRPTFAAKIDLTEEQFHRILEFIQSYNYRCYSLVGNQCSSFAAHVAMLGGLQLEAETSIEISPVMYYNGMYIRFWTDPSYALLTISTPDALERSLMQAVREGKAQQVP